MSYHSADSKLVKQDLNGTVILPPLVFPGQTLHPSLKLVSKAVSLFGFHSILTFLTNIRLGWKWLAVTNMLAYKTAVLITTIKGFIDVSTEKIYGCN